MVLQPSTTMYFLMKQFFVITVLKSIVPFCNTFVKAGVKCMWSLTLQCIMHRNDACWFCSNVQNPCPILKIPFKSLLASNDPLSWVWPKNMLTDFLEVLFSWAVRSYTFNANLVHFQLFFSKNCMLTIQLRQWLWNIIFVFYGFELGERERMCTILSV